jgi:hypothetical protein
MSAGNHGTMGAQGSYISAKKMSAGQLHECWSLKLTIGAAEAWEVDGGKLLILKKYLFINFSTIWYDFFLCMALYIYDQQICM